GHTARQQSSPIEPAAPIVTDRWERRFADLLAFKAAEGHCNVPSNYEPDRSLAVWVFNCRRQRKLGSLSAERIERLDAIGFGWDRGGDSRWDEMYAELADFQHDHGHCRISTLSDDNRALGVWVHTQRTLCKQGRLDADRIARLDAIGFTWDLLRAQWD